MSGLKKFVIFLALLVIAFPVSIYGYVFTKLKTIQDDSINTEALSSNDYKNEENITNILLLGTDARPGEEVSRSDAMMILTIDNKNKSLKLTSLNRDTYVNIPGRGEQKLTHAYVYGQANLLIETIEENFQLDIQNYAVVDFFSFMDIVDALGGVTVTVDKSEIRELNKFIPETYKWNKNDNKGSLKYIRNSGEQKLNGYQTLAFSRIRKNDSTDERDRRQRSVIQSLINGVKDLPVTKYPNLVNTILPYVKTNMNPNEIISLGKELLSIGNLDLKSMEFPLSTENGRKIGNAGYVIPFEEYELDAMHDFIFKDIMVED
ncbi:LCP family protein [Clostridioides difficile]|uniref:LCP family protein n=1 Tax=Clostridioides difficile TaxID=1496 RepID=UPI0008A1190E|nr:LCP family protein [Clostridioides difficile]OFU02842.1 LytR family transcriptional regulator [Clostridium sp. HMSC19D07]EGT4052355.1 LytR family transcriptional regulator [Clostridioides difficile]EGT4531732.1 LytR family transcriptional regulator [Clostridioides difficile]EGT4708663.1 LytR family transcriptional regulator [Clostridioides difficile]EGT4835781.1 LytR family transcriptional regulator [Clostridioides difficile]